MDTNEICSLCFMYEMTGDATIFDGHTETSEEGDALMVHVGDSLNAFIGEHEIMQQVIPEDGCAEPFFSNSKCQCCGSLPGMRYEVSLVCELEADHEYDSAVFMDMLSEIPTDIMEEVRHDQ
jgi:hypothetical protein